MFERSLRAAHADLDRRDFLKKTAAVSIALSTPSFFKPVFAKDKPTPKKVTIVGAGLAGLSAAYYLNKAGVECEIYEASNRLGGRVLTLENFNADHQFCELGAELIDSNHSDLIELATVLGLQIENFAEGDKGFIPESFFIDGKTYYTKDLEAAVKPLVKQVWKDVILAFPIGEANINLPTAHTKALDRMSIAEYLEQITGVEPWVKKAIGAAYLGEFGLDLDEQSALNLVTIVDRNLRDGFRPFGDSDESKRIHGGNSKIIAALEKALSGKVAIHLGHELKSFEKEGTQLSLQFETGGAVKKVSVEQAIVTIPYSVLRAVGGLDALNIPAKKRKAIDELGYGLNNKHMMSFKKRFWREENEKMRATTGSVYSNTYSQSFWETSRLQSGEKGILTNFVAGRNATVAIKSSRIENVIEDLVLIHGERARENFEGRHILMSWTTSPYSQGSYACARPGQFLTLFMHTGGVIGDGAVYLAGEHCSRNSPGYMNGAVDSAKLAVKKILG